MNLDFWIFTTDANGVPKASAAVPAVAISANIVAISVVSAGTGVYSARARLRDGAQVASALMSWSVDSIGYVQQVVFGGGDVSVGAFTTAGLNSISASSVTVVPSSATVARRAGTNYFLVYTGEVPSISITILDGGGNAIDLSAKTLGVYWETGSQDAVASLTSGITVGGAGSNVITFALPSAVSATARELVFAVRDQSSPFTVYSGGVFDIRYLPGS